MAETQPQGVSQPSPDIGSIVGGGDKGTISDLVTMQKARTAEDFSITRKADAQLSSDQARVEAAYKAEGVGHDELKPWDANKEHAKFEHDPIEGFGSVGGVFAMVASAFTRTPMDNAINGMAGALNSIKAGDEAAYERAYGSWKDNTKLALDRHKVQHDLYSDALSLMSANQGAAQAKLHNAAVRFGDQQMLVLAEHGMVKELFELQESRARAASQMQDLADKTDLRSFQRQAVKATVAGIQKTGDPVVDAIQLTAAIQKIYDPGKSQGNAEQAAVADFVLKHQNDPDFADKLAELHQKFSARNADPKVQAYNDQVAKWQTENPGVEMPEDVQHRILEQTGNLGKPGMGSGGVLTKGRDEAAAIRKLAEEYRKPEAEGGKSMNETDAYIAARKKIQIETATPTGHDLMGNTAKVQRIDLMEDTIGKIEGLLKKHNALTGLGGTITRPAESVSNVFGSNATDRRQFERWVTEMQEWAPAALNDRNGRPLSAEADKIKTIIAGLRPGDTTANTARAYNELRPLLKKIKEQLQVRASPDGSVPKTGAPDEKTGKDAPWLKDPVKP